MYYVMSVPEILVLMFVLFLWVLSIVWFFKRYEKISTIERADLGHHNINLDKQEIEALFTQYDTNGNGRLDYNEFLVKLRVCF